jgi:hypothetical protein
MGSKEGFLFLLLIFCWTVADARNFFSTDMIGMRNFTFEKKNYVQPRKTNISIYTDIWYQYLKRLLFNKYQACPLLYVSMIIVVF